MDINDVAYYYKLKVNRLKLEIENGLLMQEELERAEIILQALQEKLKRENPKPLTVEQLKERVGKPVFMYRKTYAKISRWFVITEVTDINMIYGIDEGFNYYCPSIDFYDYEPKGEKYDC